MLAHNRICFRLCPAQASIHPFAHSKPTPPPLPLFFFAAVREQYEISVSQGRAHSDSAGKVLSAMESLQEALDALEEEMAAEAKKKREKSAPTIHTTAAGEQEMDTTTTEKEEERTRRESGVGSVSEEQGLQAPSAAVAGGKKKRRRKKRAAGVGAHLHEHETSESGDEVCVSAHSLGTILLQ